MFESYVQLYLKYEYWFAATQLFLAMLGMGATLKLEDFLRLFTQPKSIVTGICIQLLLVVGLTLLMTQLLPLSIGMLIGLAICAAVPGGTTSNIFTHLAHANTALSVTLTTICSVASLITAPLILAIIISNDLPSDFTMPSAIVARDILLNLLLPLSIGMLIFNHKPQICTQLSSWAIRLSLLIILGIVIGAFGAGRINLDAFGSQNLITVVGFVSLMLVLSFLLPGLLKLTLKNTIAISMEVTVRNINLGLLIHVAFFASGNYLPEIANTALMVLLLYGALQMIFCLPLIIIGRLKT